jgi:hypothetical protein
MPSCQQHPGLQSPLDKTNHDFDLLPRKSLRGVIPVSHDILTIEGDSLSLEDDARRSIALNGSDEWIRRRVREAVSIETGNLTVVIPQPLVGLGDGLKFPCKCVGQPQVMADFMREDAHILPPANGRHLEPRHHNEVVINPRESATVGSSAGSWA